MKGFLDAIQDSTIEVVEVESSGDYLAFLDEGDPVYLPREIVDWMDARREPETFLKKLSRRLKRN